jgi:hypothetical protein
MIDSTSVLLLFSMPSFCYISEHEITGRSAARALLKIIKTTFFFKGECKSGQ